MSRISTAIAVCRAELLSIMITSLNLKPLAASHKTNYLGFSPLPSFCFVSFVTLGERRWQVDVISCFNRNELWLLINHIDVSSTLFREKQRWCQNPAWKLTAMYQVIWYINQGQVVQKLVNANLELKVHRSINISCIKEWMSFCRLCFG